MKFEDFIKEISQSREFGKKRNYSPDQEIEKIKLIAKAIFSEEFQVDQNNEEILKILIAWFNRDEKVNGAYMLSGKKRVIGLSKGLFLHGHKGTGKTWLTFILQKYSKLNNMYFQIVTAKKMAADFEQHGFSALEKYLIGNWSIDDIGDEPQVTKHFGSEINVVDYVLTERYINYQRKPEFTIITSNYYYAELDDYYSDRISDRFKHWLNDIPLIGDSRRK